MAALGRGIRERLHAAERNRERRALRQDRVEELARAWEQQDFARAWRLAYLISGKRSRVIPKESASADDWAGKLKSHPHEGGAEARDVGCPRVSCEHACASREDSLSVTVEYSMAVAALADTHADPDQRRRHFVR